MSYDQSQITIRPVNDLRLKDYLMIETFPSQITEMLHIKCGKHGGAKWGITGTDIFTDKNHKTLIKAGTNVDVPIVTKTKYQVIDVDLDEMFVTILTDSDETLDIQINESDEWIFDKLKDFENIEYTIELLEAIGKQRVLDIKKE